MKQRGLVTAVYEDGTADVAVMRLSACEGCHKANPGMNPDKEEPSLSVCHECMMFPQNAEMTVRAKNPCAAVRGDKVILETSTSMVLGYAYAVFLAPILAAAILGTIGAMFFGAFGGYTMAAAGFFLVFMVLKLFVDKFAAKNTEYLIAGIL